MLYRIITWKWNYKKKKILILESYISKKFAQLKYFLKEKDLSRKEYFIFYYISLKTVFDIFKNTYVQFDNSKILLSGGKQEVTFAIALSRISSNIYTEYPRIILHRFLFKGNWILKIQLILEIVEKCDLRAARIVAPKEIAISKLNNGYFAWRKWGKKFFFLIF